MNTLIGQDLETAAQFLKEGALVAIPTETVYGLAANAFNVEAVAKIFEAKNRPSFDPLIVHTHSIEEVEKFTLNFPEKAKKLAKKFWPGSLTILLPKNQLIPDLVTAGLNTVAVRIPNHPLTIELLKNLEFPLAAPSANPFGYISPTTALHVEAQLEGKVGYIIDGGYCRVGIESTIIEIKDNKTIIYRLGGISVETIKNEIGEIEEIRNSSSNPKASGMLASHYAPSKPIVLGNIDTMLENHDAQKTGILAFRTPQQGIPESHQVVLSKSGDFAEAAQHLFAGMRYLDGLDIDVILTELLPEEGLGRAINDRLRRASTTKL